MDAIIQLSHFVMLQTTPVLINVVFFSLIGKF